MSTETSDSEASERAVHVGCTSQEALAESAEESYSDAAQEIGFESESVSMRGVMHTPELRVVWNDPLFFQKNMSCAG